MLGSTDSYFWLKTSQYVMEVTRFTLRNWGISREYAIDLIVEDPAHLPSLNESVMFEFEGHTLHAFVEMLSESWSGGHYECLIALVSPLTHLLRDYCTRLYGAYPLETALKLLLEEAGLKAGLDLELRFNTKDQTCWIHQDNDHSFEYLQRILRTHGLYYAYEHSQQGVVCVISDCLERILPSVEGVRTLKSSRGHHDPDGFYTMRAVSQLKSGVMNQSIDPGPVQALLDEASWVWSVTLPFQSFCPAQTFHFDDALLPPFKLCSMEVAGVNEQARGSRCIEDNTQLHRGRLQATLKLSAAFSGLPQCEKASHVLHTTWDTAQVVQDASEYPDLSQAGDYHIRLHQDVSKEPAARTKSWVRNALYFSGHHYGFSYPFSHDTEVLIGYENGMAQRPIILGSFPNQMSPSVVTSENQAERLFRTPKGSELCVLDGSDESRLLLSTVSQSNIFLLYQDMHQATITMQTKQGSFTVDAHTCLCFSASDGFVQKSRGSQRLWSGKEASLESKQADIKFHAQACISMKSETKVSFIAAHQSMKAKERFFLASDKSVHVHADKTLTLASAYGEQLWRIEQGGLALTSTKRLTIKCQASSLTITPMAVTWVTDKNIVLQSPAVSGLAV